jgi:NitT/TauT family transport system substrate-binding protein
MVVNTATLAKNPKLGKALVGAWYETMSLMLNPQVGTPAIEAMAKASGTDVPGYRSQLATTRLFAKPSEAYEFMTGEGIVRSMDQVRHFSFEHGILGQGASSVDAVGIQFGRDKVLGNKSNITMRFDTGYTKMAVDGLL